MQIPSKRKLSAVSWDYGPSDRNLTMKQMFPNYRADERPGYDEAGQGSDTIFKIGWRNSPIARRPLGTSVHDVQAGMDQSEKGRKRREIIC